MGNLTRLSNWEQRYLDLIRSRRNLPYAYGSNDCACLAQDVVIALTGVDPLPGITRPTTAFGAARFLIERGCADIEELADQVLGTRLPSVKFASRGDLVSFMSEDDGEKHLAVCMGAIAATPGNTNMIYIRSQLWRSGWKV